MSEDVAPRISDASDLVALSTAVFFAPEASEPALPATLRRWLHANRLAAVIVRSADDLMARALRGRPDLVCFDARSADPATRAAALAACARLKRDSFTGIVPAVVLSGSDDAQVAGAFEAQADEVIREGLPDRETLPRLDTLLARSRRDTGVHPSTRLPGTDAIDEEIARRLARGAPFAVCYADLDHFKEYNDRYSYREGDRVIRILARVLHDVVKGMCGEQGFIGHIGGDDFIFIIAASAVTATCEEIVNIFDTLAPYQYAAHDRRSGYFFGKDRRGQLHRVPLMTVSIGVVTNERRQFSHASQMAELATEMKSYAKTLEGSVYTIDRRYDSADEPAIVVSGPARSGRGAAGLRQSPAATGDDET
jgi:diguanylate cyclase (GGDEF)-like protein